MILTPIDTLKTTMQAQGARGTALLRKRVKENGVGSLWWGAFATAAATFAGHYPWFATVRTPTTAPPPPYSSFSLLGERESVAKKRDPKKKGDIGVLTLDIQYNFLMENIEEPPKHPLIVWLARLAFIGFCASIVSDSVSNSLRVVKTYRQVNETKVSYCTSNSFVTHLIKPTWLLLTGPPFCCCVCTAEAARLVVLQDGILGLFGRGLKTRIIANGLQGILFSILWKLFLDL